MLKCLNAKMRNSGFTLVEILVVISIIIIMSGIVFVGYREGERQLILQRAANKLAQDIRRVEEMAMSAKECQPCGGGVPVGGYGVYFDKSNPSSYIIYADTQPPQGNEFYTPGDNVVETLQLESGVFIQNINTTPEKVGINFKPPDPAIMIKFPNGGGNGQEITALDAIITLALTADPSKTKTIKVNKVGRIDID